MHKSAKFAILIFAITLLFSSNSHSQRRAGSLNILEGMSVTARGGYNMFFGDLVDKSRGSFSVGGLVDREMNEMLSARVQLIGGKMQGTQVFPSSGLEYAYFDNIYTEFSIGGTYKPLNHIMGYFRQRTFQPYVHLNAGLVYYSSTEYWGEVGSGPQDEEWRSASEIAPMVSAGGGASFWINPMISANIEITGALPFTDRMDVHDVWYSGDDWQTEMNPVSTDPYDVYYNFMVGVTFVIQDSKLRNDPKYNRKSYIKTRQYYQSKSRRSPARRPNRKRFLFF